MMIVESFRDAAFRYLWLFLVPLLLVGCDVAGPRSQEASPVEVDSTSALTVHPLSFTEVLRTHPDVLPTWEDQADRGEEDAPAEIGDEHLHAPYVCVISSPNLTGKGGPEARYRYDGVVLDFAPAVLATARSMSSGGGVPTRMIEVQTGAHVNPRHEEGQVLRWARCRVPDAPGVEAMVTERLGYADYRPGRADAENQASEAGKHAGMDLRNWEGVPVEDRTFAALLRSPGKITCATETVCVKRCASCPPEDCVIKGVDCYGVDDGLGGSGGSGTGYDDGGYSGSGLIPTITPDKPEAAPHHAPRCAHRRVDTGQSVPPSGSSIERSALFPVM